MGANSVVALLMQYILNPSYILILLFVFTQTVESDLEKLNASMVKMTIPNKATIVEGSKIKLLNIIPFSLYVTYIYPVKKPMLIPSKSKNIGIKTKPTIEVPNRNRIIYGTKAEKEDSLRIFKISRLFLV